MACHGEHTFTILGLVGLVSLINNALMGIDALRRWVIQKVDAVYFN